MREPEATPELVAVRVLAPYRIWVRYDDGVTGEVDLSHLAGLPLYAPWSDPEFFARARIEPGGYVSWGDQIDVSPDDMYMKLTGMTPEEYWPGLRAVRQGA